MIHSLKALRPAIAGLQLIAIVAFGVPASAQHEHHQDPPPAGWSWSVDSSVFLTGNFQIREFRDFHHAESQNWLMAAATRRLANGTLALHGMFSFEPFTLRDLGSSQAFQTGETFGGAPLIDYQHPHDLFMGLSAAYDRPVGRVTWLLRGGLVDSPALGPTPFMHRPSASLHPTATLGHHQLDSTHIAHGVVTGGLRAGRWQFEASAFRGREPDEDRLDLDLGALDSTALRASWIHAGNRAQVSIGWLEDPHISEPGDITRVTASIEHQRMFGPRAAAFTAAWGQNRGDFSNEDAFLLEAAVSVTLRGAAYVRGEIVDKHILEAGGLHPPGLQHPHILSTVKALTVGYQHALIGPSPIGSAPLFSVGADVTGHLTPANLVSAYGRPLSIHVYGRWTLRYAVRPVKEGR
jgi:hypothetical protein